MMSTKAQRPGFWEQKDVPIMQRKLYGKNREAVLQISAMASLFIVFVGIPTLRIKYMDENRKPYDTLVPKNEFDYHKRMYDQELKLRDAIREAIKRDKASAAAEGRPFVLPKVPSREEMAQNSMRIRARELGHDIPRSLAVPSRASPTSQSATDCH